MSKRLRQDIRYLTSVLLLVAVIAAFLTGWLADVWGINTFVIHTWTGYGMTLLALIHTVWEWPRLLAYIRARRRHVPARPDQTTPPLAGAPLTSPRRTKPLLTRRDLLSALVGGIGGFILGRRLTPSAHLPEHADLGMQYHIWSKPGVSNPLTTLIDWGQRPAQYKSYPNAPRISLPVPEAAHGLLLEEAIRQRRSIRTYAATPMTRQALSRLLFHTNGITAERWGFRAAPSAGALYPIETYVVVHRVEGIEAGVYHYQVQDHTLAQVRADDLRNEIVRACIWQSFLGEASVVLILTSIWQRLRWRYQERTYRYAMLEAGHIGQNIYLTATAMGMGACAVGAFDDDALNKLVGIDGIEEAVVYVLAVGQLA